MRPTARLPLSTALSLALLVVSSPPGGAQPAPPDAAPPQRQSADPPARVGRLAKLNGTVSFHPTGAEQWDAAALNDPVAAGMSLWTEPRSEAVAEVSGARIVLAPSTELDVNTLDARTLDATEPQGEACLLVQQLSDGDTVVVRTPRGAVTIRGPGRYGVAAGDTASPTRVAVLAGAAEVLGTGVDLRLAAGQTGVISGTDTLQSAVAPAGCDDFLQAACAPSPPVARPVAGLPPVVAEMPGGEDLALYGTWQPSPEYGSVWYPQVPAGWVPYREGHWAYVAPWGWTWVDNAPWGFAPFHYGRWAEIDGRWGWMPAPIRCGRGRAAGLRAGARSLH